MGRKIRIAVDLDDTIVDFRGGVIDVLRERGDPDPEATFVEWAQTGDERMAEIYRQKGFFDNLKSLMCAIYCVKVLAQEYDVWICSSPPNTSFGWSAKHDWVVRKFGREWSERLILMSDKSMLQVDVLIDDRPFIHDTPGCQKSWVGIMRRTGDHPHMHDKYPGFEVWDADAMKTIKHVIDRL